MPVVGTAGHVDHGKSTLVQALTGRDPDRWEEEKRRGLTIDLGFAWTTLDSGVDVGFVDVPGHERFIKNMLAGVDAIDVAVFAVAADEGWMPQSEEHLAILDLLGVSRGVVALTRSDLVDQDTLELVTLEVDERLAGTTLEGSPIIPTALPEGRGLAELRLEIDRAVAGSATGDVGRPRLWVDRAFTIEGAGTVITGTLVDGRVALDDTLVLFPGAVPARVRSIQSHERSVDAIGPGNRAAFNVVGVEREQIDRGSMLGAADQWRPTTRFTADARTVRHLAAPLREHGSFHVHIGSGSWPAHIRLLEGASLEGSGAIAVELPVPLPVRFGDRFIVREVGRQAVVAGGRVLDPDPPRRLREMAPMLEPLRAATDADEAATALLEARGRSSLRDLAAHSGGGRPRRGLITERVAFSQPRVARLLETADQIVASFHGDNPLRPGIPKASLAARLRITVDDLEALLRRSEALEAEGPVVRASGFDGDLDDASRQVWEDLRTELLAAGPSPPRRKEIEIDPELMHALVRGGRLVEVSDELVYLPETLADIERRVRTMPDGFTVADFRDDLDITRKYAVPLLEWMDARGVTRRQGEGRVVRRQQPGAPAPDGAPSR